MTDLVKAQQGAIVLIAVVGAGASPPVTPTGAPRRYAIGRGILVPSGRMR